MQKFSRRAPAGKHRRLVALALAGSLFGAGAQSGAATIYLDVAKGADINPGTVVAPVKTFKKALGLAGPGDTVQIVKVDFPIHDSLVTQNKSGEVGRPITLDGQGNTFTGCDPLRPEDWTEVRPGVFRNPHLVPGMAAGGEGSAATLMRYFMFWNGEQNRMGRSSKGFLPPLPTPDQLRPGQWTYVEAEGAFYLAIDPAKKLQDYKIETPVRQNGVGLGGTSRHWVVRNVNVTRFINDGFNVHGDCEDVLFENITATECGDDGFSAHEQAKITVRGLTARRNSTGMCQGDPVTLTGEKMVLEDNYAYNLLLRDGAYIFDDCTISAVAPPGGKGGIALVNEPRPGSRAGLSVKLTRCRVPFPVPGVKPPRPPFDVDAEVVLDVSPDSKIGGEVTRKPPKPAR